MPLSSFEVAMQTMASVLSDCLEKEKSVPVITKDGLNQLMKEQFPHCEKKEIRQGVYWIRIPLRKTSPEVSHDKLQLTETNPGYSPFDFQEVPRDQIVSLSVQLELFSEYLDTILESFNPGNPA